MNHTRLPKEVLLPDWARRGKQGKNGDRIELRTTRLIVKLGEAAF